MPMLDAYIPADALTPAAEEQLLADLTDILIKNEGADPSSEVVRSIAWVFVHRPAEVYVAGARASAPRYRFIASVPEGQYNPERREAMVRTITDAVLDAEAGAYERDPSRVWVFTPEIAEGTWGGMGRVVKLADIAGFAMGDAELGQRYAEGVFAARETEAETAAV
jgi:phenylpyruvate tautomerase PptA (4-oxalocrotonate tautomerase family)